MAETRMIFDPFENKTVVIRNDLVLRLRGQYANGPTLPSGEPEFGWRQFETPPIQKEAADEIERLRTENGTLRGEIGTQPEAKVSMLREFSARVHGALDDYSSLEPEQDETWESWFHAAFDLAGSKISKALDEAITQARALTNGERPE